jgi:hypothetical protein
MKFPSVLSLAALAAMLPAAALAQDGPQTGISEIDSGVASGINTRGARQISAKDTEDRKAAPKTFEELLAAEKQETYNGLQWSEDEGNAGFDAETRAQIRVLSAVGPLDQMRHFKVVFDPKLGVHENRFEFMAMSNGIRLLHVRGVKKYVALDYGVGSQYYKVGEFAHYVQHVWDSSLNYTEAGSYDVAQGQMNDVTDVDLVADILTRFMKVQADDRMVTTVRERVSKLTHGKPFIVSGGAKVLYLGVGEQGFTIWPNEIKAH